MKYDTPKFLMSGECSLIVEFGNGIDPDINLEVQKLMREIESLQMEEIVETVPTYRSLLIQYNPLLISFSEMTAIVRERLSGKKSNKHRKNHTKNAWFVPIGGGFDNGGFGNEFDSSGFGGLRDGSGESADGFSSRGSGSGGLRDSGFADPRPSCDEDGYVRLIEIPTLYGGEHGPDLAYIAEYAGRSETDVVRMHSGRDYLVYMMGFMPGFPYLGGLDPRIAAPRLSDPRSKILAGSVGIAGEQTGVYPSDSPGGWRLIGRTPRKLYDPSAEQPVQISSGDYVRFVPVGISEYRRIESAPNRKFRVRAVHRSEIRSADVALTEDNLGEFGREYFDQRNDVSELKALPDGHIVPARADDRFLRVKVIRPGALTTVQDLGRVGFQKYGIPVAGAMDERSHRLANLLVGNPESEAVLEATYIGPELQFEANAQVAITGADLQPRINGESVPMYEAFEVRTGDVLSFGTTLGGVRTYIAVAGSLSVPEVNGSKSTYLKSALGGYMGRKLQKEDVLEYAVSSDTDAHSAVFSDARLADEGADEESRRRRRGGGVRLEAEDESLRVRGCTRCEIRVLPGPQDDLFTEKGLDAFFGADGYEVTAESDRMGMKLSGKPIERRQDTEFVSDATVIGAIQIPASGEPIILLADRQTTGGYPKIGVVIKEDLCKLAQLMPGTKVIFRKIEPEEAQQRYRKFYDELERLGGGRRK